MAHMRTYQIHRPFASRSRRWTYDRRRVPPQDWTFGRHLPCRKGPDFEGVTNSYCCTCFHPHHPSPPGQLQRFQPPHSALISEGPLAGPSPGRSTRALLPRAPLKVGCPLLCIVTTAIQCRHLTATGLPSRGSRSICRSRDTRDTATTPTQRTCSPPFPPATRPRFSFLPHILLSTQLDCSCRCR